MQSERGSRKVEGRLTLTQLRKDILQSNPDAFRVYKLGRINRDMLLKINDLKDIDLNAAVELQNKEYEAAVVMADKKKKAIEIGMSSLSVGEVPEVKSGPKEPRHVNPVVIKPEPLHIPTPLVNPIVMNPPTSVPLLVDLYEGNNVVPVPPKRSISVSGGADSPYGVVVPRKGKAYPYIASKEGGKICPACGGGPYAAFSDHIRKDCQNSAWFDSH